MDFETMVVLKMLRVERTTEQVRNLVFEFYGNFAVGAKVGGIVLKLEQAGLVNKTGLPARYRATEAGLAELEDFEQGIRRYQSYFGIIFS
jgi:hypothetical protein